LVINVRFILIFLVGISLLALYFVDWFITRIANVGFVLFGNFFYILRSRFNINVCIRKSDGLWPSVSLSLSRVVAIGIDLLAVSTDVFDIRAVASDGTGISLAGDVDIRMVDLVGRDLGIVWGVGALKFGYVHCRRPVVALLGGLDLLDCAIIEFVWANITRERRGSGFCVWDEAAVVGVAGGGPQRKRQQEQDHWRDGQEFNHY
jgi:hypothetical protein